MEDNKPNTIEEENLQHWWIWKWGSVGVICIFGGIGAFCMAIDALVCQPYGSVPPVVAFFRTLLEFIFSFCIITTPALLVRILVSKPLHMFVGLLLSLLGICIAFSIDYALGEKIHMGLPTIVIAVCSYKIARSLFGLRSIGIPISLHSDRKIGESTPKGAEENAQDSFFLDLSTSTDKNNIESIDDIFDLDIEETKSLKVTNPDDAVETENSSESAAETAYCSQKNRQPNPVAKLTSPSLKEYKIAKQQPKAVQKEKLNKALLLFAILFSISIITVMAYSLYPNIRYGGEIGNAIATLKMKKARSDFWDGVREGNCTKVEKAIKAGIDVNEINRDGELSYTALQFATKNGNTEMVELLLHKGAEINKETSSCKNLWYMVAQCEAGNLTIERLITILCHAGLDPNLPIIIELTESQKQAVQAFIDDKTKKLINEANEKSFDGKSIAQKVEPVLNEMLASRTINTCILNIAVQKGLTNAIRVMLDCGANPNGIGEITTAMNTPLYIAATARNTEIVILLVEHGANTNWKDGISGTSPLLTAIGLPGGKTDRELVKYLVEHGANCKQTNRSGVPYIHFAAANGDTEIVGLFISRGVNINTLAEPSRYTPLRMALEYEQYDCVKWLIEHDANIHIEDVEHLTPAMLIYFKGKEDPRWMDLLTPHQQGIALKDINEWQRKYSHLYR